MTSLNLQVVHVAVFIATIVFFIILSDIFAEKTFIESIDETLKFQKMNHTLYDWLSYKKNQLAAILSFSTANLFSTLPVSHFIYICRFD